MDTEEEQFQNTLIVQKVKFKFWGQVGQIQLSWNPENGRYDEQGTDYTNWIYNPINHKSKVIDFSVPSNDFVPF